MTYDEWLARLPEEGRVRAKLSPRFVWNAAKVDEAQEVARLRRENIEQSQPDFVIRAAMLLAAFRADATQNVGDLRGAAVTMFGEDAVARAVAWYSSNQNGG